MNKEDPRRREEKERSVESSHDTGANEEEFIYRNPTSNTHGEPDFIKLIHQRNMYLAQHG